MRKASRNQQHTFGHLNKASPNTKMIRSMIEPSLWLFVAFTKALIIFRFLRCAPSSKVFCLLHAERLLSGLSFRASPFTDSTSQLFLNRFPSSGHEVMLLHGRCILLQVLSTPTLSPAHFQG
ncbi:hypothetical protein T4E_8473 [Trichinella pseudospiralis]|uniref:Uncharacterized protein n=1 Tax=Trichinella pseudospiralis TaxID=6337 RepID=A0A0V0YPG6_TRIPS|nr:hypothetical protein T4E_8473 [Trichinella pseudospiralis]